MDSRTSKMRKQSARRYRRAAPALLLAVAAGIVPAHAAVFVGGDSLGVGVSMASDAPSVADESVRIKGRQVLEQIARVPEGSTLVLSLGTNDAVGGVTAVEDAVAAIVAAASTRDIALVWLGPPCVFKDWDAKAAELDGVLAKLLVGTGVTYVSMRDADLCSKALRAKDGVHFTMKGYEAMWTRAMGAVGGEAVTVAAVAAPIPAPPRASAPVAVNVPLPRPRPEVLSALAALRAGLALFDTTAPVTDAPPIPRPRPVWRPAPTMVATAVEATPVVVATRVAPIPMPRPSWR